MVKYTFLILLVILLYTCLNIHRIKNNAKRRPVLQHISPSNLQTTKPVIAKIIPITRCGIFFCVPTVAERGILMVAYSRDSSTFKKFHDLTIKRAKENKALKTNIPIAVATQNITSEILEYFDYVIEIPDNVIYKGVQLRTSTYSPQWRTRLLMYGSSPFKNTLAIDSDTWIDKPVDPLFDAFEPFDFASLNQERDAIYEYLPQGGILMFKNNINIFFNKWWQFQMKELERKNEDDQGALKKAMKNTKLKYGVIQSSAALCAIHFRWTKKHMVDILPIIRAKSEPMLLNSYTRGVFKKYNVSKNRAITLTWLPQQTNNVFYNESDCEECFKQPYEHWTFSNPPSEKFIVPLNMSKVSKYWFGFLGDKADKAAAEKVASDKAAAEKVAADKAAAEKVAADKAAAEKVAAEKVAADRMIIIEMLVWIRDIAPEIKWSLTYGTLLGAARSKSIIRGDYNADISVSVDEYKILQSSILEKLPSTHYVFEPITTYKKLWKFKGGSKLYYSTNHSTYIVLWPHQKFKTTTEIFTYKKWQMTSFHNDKLYPLQECDLEHEKFMCFKNMSFVLSVNYGPNWMIQRSNHVTRLPQSPGAGVCWGDLSTKNFEFLKKTIKILDNMHCPYNIHGPILKSITSRNCNLEDLYIAIPSTWLKYHATELHQVFASNGFDKVKEDNTMTIYNFKHFNVSVFAAEYFKSKYIIGNCSVHYTDIGTTKWGNVELRLPFPYKKVYSSLLDCEYKAVTVPANESKICSNYPLQYSGELYEKSLELLLYLNEICDFEKIDWTLAYDSAFGWKRWQTFTPYHNNTEIVIMSKDSKKLQSLITHPFCLLHFSGGFKVFKCPIDEYNLRHPFVNVWDGTNKKYANMQLDSIMFPSKPIVFSGYVLRGPFDVEEHLNRVYSSESWRNVCNSLIWNRIGEKGSEVQEQSYPCSWVENKCWLPYSERFWPKLYPCSLVESNCFDVFKYPGLQTSRNQESEKFNKMLRWFDKISRKFKINYSLTAGTLLGWRREGHHITKDLDADVIIGISELPKLISLIEKGIALDSANHTKIDSSQIFLLVRKYDYPKEEFPRLNCKGRKVLTQEDSCAFKIPQARVIFMNKHLDIWLMSKNPHHVACPFKDGIQIPKVYRCRLENVETSCFGPQTVSEYLNIIYNKKWMVPKVSIWSKD